MTTRLPFTRVDELVKSSLKELKVREVFKVYPVWEKWSELVGNTIAVKAQPDYVKGGTLVVSVENSVWMNELEMQKALLLKKIASLNLNFTIDNIRFRMKRN